MKRYSLHVKFTKLITFSSLHLSIIVLIVVSFAGSCQGHSLWCPERWLGSSENTRCTTCTACGSFSKGLQRPDAVTQSMTHSFHKILSYQTLIFDLPGCRIGSSRGCWIYCGDVSTGCKYNGRNGKDAFTLCSFGERRRKNDQLLDTGRGWWICIR